jgi:hypothetical protein
VVIAPVETLDESVVFVEFVIAETTNVPEKAVLLNVVVPVTFKFPPMTTFFDTPSPPDNTRHPVVEFVESVVLVTPTIPPMVAFPYVVKNVPIVAPLAIAIPPDTTIAPLVELVVSTPLLTDTTPETDMFPPVLTVPEKVLVPPTVIFVPMFNPLDTPIPPATVSDPDDGLDASKVADTVTVFAMVKVLEIDTFPLNAETPETFKFIPT